MATKMGELSSLILRTSQVKKLSIQICKQSIRDSLKISRSQQVRKLCIIIVYVALTSTSKARGSRCLHSLPSVVPVFGETVDNRICCLFLPFLLVLFCYLVFRLLLCPFFFYIFLFIFYLHSFYPSSLPFFI